MKKNQIFEGRKPSATLFRRREKKSRVLVRNLFPSKFFAFTSNGLQKYSLTFFQSFLVKYGSYFLVKILIFYLYTIPVVDNTLFLSL